MKRIERSFYLAIFLLNICSVVYAENNFSALNSYLQSVSKKNVTIGVAVGDVEEGKIVYSFHGKEPLTPASVQKLVVTVAALKQLGSEHQFKTEFYVDRLPYRDVPNGKVGNLTVVGSGDPSLVTESLWLAAKKLEELGVSEIQDIILDDSRFVGGISNSGFNPYQTGSSALSFNFNSVSVFAIPRPEQLAKVSSVFPGFPEISNKLQSSSSAQTAVAVDSDFKSDSSVLQITGVLNRKDQSFSNYYSVNHPQLYFGAALKELLQNFGVEVKGKLVEKMKSGEAQFLYAHESKELALILRDMNRFSNNFIANQVLFALGEDEQGKLEQELALRRVHAFVEKLGVGREEFRIVDGSGLDRANKISPEALVRVLNFGASDFSIASDLISSLSRFGISGTLKTRPFYGAGSVEEFNKVWAKTGTINEVSSLAGILEGKSGRKLSFAIMVNGLLEKETASKIENSIVQKIVGM